MTNRPFQYRCSAFMMLCVERWRPYSAVDKCLLLATGILLLHVPTQEGISTTRMAFCVLRAAVSARSPHFFTPPLRTLRRFGPYFVMPVIAGLEDDGSVYLSGMDSLGAIETAKDFIVAGSAPDSLSGMCESMFRPDMVRVLDPSPHTTQYLLSTVATSCGRRLLSYHILRASAVAGLVAVSLLSSCGLHP